ncbi:MAG: ATP-dependent 6-phosphofructokinase [Kiritimatiellia bacterium]|jgi:6-phosphofructokinase 1|nr:ATP-dependent 6-phosphofructokinase [Kiritimatiellia bacterium]MDP6848933.1 ATP-dependent 6-phosphofructokinase [Kiritimatiellia bacterium]
MINRLEIQTLGPCGIDSPLDSRFFRDESTGVLVDATVGSDARTDPREILEQAGPRSRIFFEPARTRAAIVTCGGLCPGLNDVIRAVTTVLWYRYGVTDIRGLRYGYQGLVSSYNHQPLALTPETVEDIHKSGGTILGSSRGPQDTCEIVDFLVRNEIDILFTIGGDGTQRGSRDIAEEVRKRGLSISVIGIPKTIDNDIALTTRTFGFETAVAMSRDPINGAHNEAKGVNNGIGLVKLMGRQSGFVAAYATLASSDVNLLLVPEVPFTLESVLKFLEKRLKRKSHAVIVVAEGAGQDLAGASGQDASGNTLFGDIGLFLKNAIEEHFRQISEPVSVKYIDPSYIIRSAPASADDSVFCFQLAENAVHAAMSGRTEMVIGFWNGHFVHVPVSEAVASRKKIDPAGALWQSVLDNTGQEL